jgi:hypothetical protein
MGKRDHVPQEDIIRACECRAEGPSCDAHQLSKMQIAACYRGPKPVIDLEPEDRCDAHDTSTSS